MKTIAQELGSGLLSKGLIEEKAQYQDFRLRFVGVYSTNTREWILLDTACNLYGFTLVPIYDTLGADATQVMFEETEMPTLFLTVNHVVAMAEGIKAGKFPLLKTLVIMDEYNLTEDIRDTLKGIQYFTFSQITQAGRENIQPFADVKPEDISFFSYTSGTTGRPKGAMISHKNVINVIGGSTNSIPDIEMIYLSYLPLAHVLEKLIYTTIVYRGGQYGLFSGNIRKIKEDLAILRPTIFASVPRMYNRFYDLIQDNLNKLTGMQKVVADRAVYIKKYNYASKGHVTHTVYDNLVFNKIKKILGGRVEYCLTGSAPMSPEILEFLKIAFCCKFIEGYGQTEGFAAEFLTHPDDNTVGHVGGPAPQNEFKLRDVPSMSYFSTDVDEEGRPRPRGEIMVRGGNVIDGYYKNPEKTAESINEDGWLLSGDIGAILPGSNALKIIDRVKNIFKLSQGEYVAPDKLEQSYK